MISWNSRTDSSEKANGVRDEPRFSPKKMLLASAPSIWMLVPEVRAPPMENCPPVPTCGCGLTSGDRLRKSVKSRPATGRFSSCSVPTRCATPPCVTSTRARSPLTVIPSSVTASAASRTSTVAACPVDTRTLCVAGECPSPCTRTVYGPEGSRRMEYLPSSPAAAPRRRPVSRLVAVTCAPASGRPSAEVTCPRMLPVVAPCARAPAAPPHASIASARTRRPNPVSRMKESSGNGAEAAGDPAAGECPGKLSVAGTARQ